MAEGILDELVGVDIGDERLDKRSKRLLEDLANHPEASINAACDGWADTKAAYRFFNNRLVTPDKILQPHRQATTRRLSHHPVVLLVQDTTELDYTKHPPTDAPCLNRTERFGLYAHVHVAVTPDRLILGVTAVEFFDRAAETLGKSEQRSSLPIEQKESFRWLEGYRLACQAAAESPGTHVVSVADREADIYDIFVDAQQQTGPRAEFVVRSRVERRTKERTPAAGEAASCTVRDRVAAARVLATRTIALEATRRRSAREAKLEIRACTVEVRPPHERSGLPSVTLNLVLVEEVGGPGDGTDVSWLLLTSLPIGTAEEALTVVAYDAARWVVEVFFRTWKTGCRIEDIQLETLARLKSCPALYAIVAWRVLFATYLNRTSPKVPCTVLFTASEWKSVWLVVMETPLPRRPPDLAAMMRLLARLGGYNNRLTEPPPGPQPIWIGLRRMADFALAWEAINQEAP